MLDVEVVLKQYWVILKSPHPASCTWDTVATGVTGLFAQHGTDREKVSIVGRVLWGRWDPLSPGFSGALGPSVPKALASMLL